MMEPMPRKKKWACTTHSCGAANHGCRRLSAGAPKRRHPPKTRNPMHKQVQMRTTTHENYRTNPKNGEIGRAHGCAAVGRRRLPARRAKTAASAKNSKSDAQTSTNAHNNP